MTNFLVTLGTSGENHFQDRSEMLRNIISLSRAEGLNVDRFVWDWQRLTNSMLYKVWRNYFTPEHYLGYWTWKPYILLDALIHSEDGDIIALLDSDINVSNLPEFLELAKQRKGVFIGHNCRNDRYTPGDIFYLMDMPEEQYYSANHVWGAVNFLLRCPETMAFAQDWLTCSLSMELQLSQNKYRPNNPGFDTTRWLQGAETNLVVKYGFEILDNGKAWSFAHPAQPLPFT